MLRARCVNLVEFDIYCLRVHISLVVGSESGTLGIEYAPHIDPKVLKRDNGRIEFGPKADIEVTDMLLRRTRHAPET